MTRYLYKISFTVLLLLAATAVSSAQVASERNLTDAQWMFAEARAVLAPAELALAGYTQSQQSPQQIQQQIRQASLYLESAVALDNQYAPAWRELVTTVASAPIDDITRADEALNQYAMLGIQDEQVIRAWISYHFNRLQSRPDREQFLRSQIQTLRDYPSILSEVMDQLATFSLETADRETARQLLQRSFAIFPYNDNALARFLELPLPEIDETNLTDTQIERARINMIEMRYVNSVYLWRVRLYQNPYNLDAALNIISLLEDISRYDLTDPYYAHAYRILARSADNQALMQDLMESQLVGAYAGRRYDVCANVAQQILAQDPQNLLANALRGQALVQLGQVQQGQTLLNNTNQIIAQRLAEQNNSDPEYIALAAWFYSFIQSDPQVALQYASLALQEAPDEVRMQAMSAYTHLMNDRVDDAAAILAAIDPCAVSDPLVVLTQAKLYQAQGDNENALATLNTMVPGAAGVFARDFEQLLAQLSPPPTPDPNAALGSPPDMLGNMLIQNFNNHDLGFVDNPQQYIRCSLRLRSDIFSYGDDMTAEISLANTSDIPLVLSPGNAVNPNILITAQINSEDAEQPVTLGHLGQRRALEPGLANRQELVLNVGPLRQRLRSHPQMDYRVTFRMYLDPVYDPQTNTFANAIPELPVTTVVVTRRGFDPDADRMRYHFQQLRNSNVVATIKSIRLLSGLLHEAFSAHQGRLQYRPSPVDHVQIYQRIVANLQNESPLIRAWSANALQGIPMGSSSATVTQLTQMLNDPHWFVRFMAVETLNDIVDLTDYLQWTAEHDANGLLQRQALLLLNQPWPTQPLTPPQPPTDQTPDPNESIPIDNITP
ncbi:MAG: hypothetical protein JW936_00965 [Sedimentisphaerales bacterium]|nr:hypothetical protein [Sedimentisphaerales bacterium]